jgi:hypothetical protein
VPQSISDRCLFFNLRLGSLRGRLAIPAHQRLGNSHRHHSGTEQASPRQHGTSLTSLWPSGLVGQPCMHNVGKLCEVASHSSAPFLFRSTESTDCLQSSNNLFSSVDLATNAQLAIPNVRSYQLLCRYALGQLDLSTALRNLAGSSLRPGTG